MNDKTAALWAEHETLSHAIQSGVGFDQETNPENPKHTRTGINIVMSDLGSLSRLLIAKGLITEEEIAEECVEGLKLEVRHYEEILSKRAGTKVKLY